MLKFLKLAYCLLAVGLTLVCQAQTIAPLATGLGDVQLCQTRSYYVPSFTPPAGRTIVGYKFTTSPGGSLANNSTYFTSNQISVVWNLANMQSDPNQGKDRYPFATVNCAVKYSYVSSGQTNYEDVPLSPLTVQIAGVGPINILGASSVTACNQSSLSYSIDSKEDADRFVWTVPVGWTVTGPGNAGISTGQNFSTTSSYINVIPNATSGGNVTCKAHLSSLEGLGPNCYYEQSASISVSRPNPVLTSPYIRKPRYCPNEQVSISVSALAGATNYTWSVPATYQIISGQGTANAVIKVGTATGTISCMATFCAGLTSIVNLSIPLYQPITTAPQFMNGYGQDYTEYHCGAYRFCTGGAVNIFEQPDYQTYTWSVAGSWTFTGASTPVGVFTQQTPVDMQAQPNGVYLICIKTETETVYRKIVLSK